MAGFDRLCNWSVTGHNSLVTSCHLPCRRPHHGNNDEGSSRVYEVRPHPFFFVLLTFSCRYRGLVAYHCPFLKTEGSCCPPPPPSLECEQEGPHCPPPHSTTTSLARMQDGGASGLLPTTTPLLNVRRRGFVAQP